MSLHPGDRLSVRVLDATDPGAYIPIVSWSWRDATRLTGSKVGIASCPSGHRAGGRTSRTFRYSPVTVTVLLDSPSSVAQVSPSW